MYTFLNHPNATEALTVCHVPFMVRRENGLVTRIQAPCMSPDGAQSNFVNADGSFDTLYFLGMSTDSWQCSEWWAQQEVLYDASTRLFFGDRIGRIRLLFSDRTEELISVIFGVNAFNYNLFFRAKPQENIPCYAAPYQMPFSTDPAAKDLLDASLAMTENKEESAEKMTKWVFAYRPNPHKKLIRIEWFKEDGKRADFVISAVTGLPAGEKDVAGLPATDRFFFLRKDWYRPIQALKRRLYQYKDEIPASVSLWEGGDKPFDAPDIRFYNENGLDLWTNVYRANVMDMAYHKVTDDGMPHTSSGGTCDFGCYIGFGTYSINGSYSSHVWTRDIGRLLIELADLGYTERVLMAVDKLHEMLYYPSIRFQIPHWKRVANILPDGDKNMFNEGNENDGHASIMMAIYNLYRTGGVDKAWLEANRHHLKAAADYYLWQESHPVESGFDGVLFSHSETSSQTYGGFDLYANIISRTALILYALLFDELGDVDYAAELRRLAGVLLEGAKERFLMDHGQLGKVWTDTTDDCWTYEYKRFVEILMACDWATYDTADKDDALFDMMKRTFEAQKEVYYHPYSGRQMGYGQGYLTTATLMLDDVAAYTDCVNASAHLSYHHTDVPYIVPEGVILHGSGEYWYRNSDQGNAVQQAEIIKEARVMVGADDLSGEGLSLVPRLPATMTAIEVKQYPVTVYGKREKISYRYARDGEGRFYVKDENACYSLNYEGVTPESVRFGPFASPDVTTNAKLIKVSHINGAYYAYVTVEP